MNRCWMRAVLACAAWMPATAALAIGEPPKVVLKPAPEPVDTTPVGPVTVEATRPGELRKPTDKIVETFSATTHNLDQLARWDIPVCLLVKGLPAEASAQVKGRVEEVAAALKVRVAKAGCGPNIQIIFTDQPQPLLDRVAAQHEHLLGYWHHRDRDKLKAVTHPIQSWYVTATNGSGGPTAGMAFENIESDGPAGMPAGSWAPPGLRGRCRRPAARRRGL